MYFFRNIIFTCIPNCKEKWNGVLFGFCNGNLLSDDLNWLEKGHRKQIYTKTSMQIAKIDVDILKTYIFEAVEIDESLKRK